MPKTKPHRREEQRLRKLGHVHIAGADEAGKGAWAGPIVAGAVILAEDFDPKIINDSKVLTAKQRERMFVHIARNAISWAVGVVPSEEIDRDGIVAANRKALELAVRRLHVPPHAVLVDAVPIVVNGTPVKAIIDGDAKCLSVAAASIVAKVARDTLMDGHHRVHPQYGFNVHKGYGTAAHEKALKKHGPSAIHRRSFAPMKPKQTVKKSKPTRSKKRRTS